MSRRCTIVFDDQKVLNSAIGKVISEAKDVYIGCQNVEQQTSVRRKLQKNVNHWYRRLDITLVNNKSNIITTNINVSDDLANGGTEKFIYIAYNDK